MSKVGDIVVINLSNVQADFLISNFVINKTSYIHSFSMLYVTSSDYIMFIEGLFVRKL